MQSNYLKKYSKRFLIDSKKLRKKHRQFDEDLLKFVKLLERGNVDDAARIQGFGGFSIYKARVQNSSSSNGKSGGFRVVYYLKTSPKTFYFLTIYSKSEKENILRNEIVQILMAEGLIK
jgi:hypothetical protein